MPSFAAMQFERSRGVTQVRATAGLAHVDVTLTPEQRLPLLRTLAQRKIPVLMVALHEGGLSFVVRHDSAAPCEAALNSVGHSYLLTTNQTLISVIAGAMRDLSGVIAQIYDALHEEGIAIRRTGDAYDAVHVLVNGSEAARAQTVLEARFPEGGGV
jgi:aspartokinase